MPIRIKDYTTTIAGAVAVDDYLAVDGTINGSRKLLASRVALWDQPNTWTKLQSIDLGTGTLPATYPSAASRQIELISDNTNAARLYATSFNNAGVSFSGIVYGGTRAAPTATASLALLFRFNGNAFDGTALYVSNRMSLLSEGVQSATNHGSRIAWDITPLNSTTLIADAMVLNGTGLTLTNNLGLGVTGNLNVSGQTSFGNSSNDYAGQGLLFLHGITKGLRMGTNVNGSYIEGVDSTGFTSFQQLALGGSVVNVTINGTGLATFSPTGLGVTGNIIATSGVAAGAGPQLVTTGILMYGAGSTNPAYLYDSGTNGLNLRFGPSSAYNYVTFLPALVTFHENVLIHGLLTTDDFAVSVRWSMKNAAMTHAATITGMTGSAAEQQYGILSFNDNYNYNGMIGILGGGSTDSGLYLAVPTGGYIQHIVNGVNVGMFNANGLSLPNTLTSGDITISRSAAPGTGALFFGNTSTKYLYYDGSVFTLTGAINVSAIAAIDPGGAGSLPAVINASTNLRLGNVDGATNTMEWTSFVATNITGNRIAARTAGGTRAAPGAITGTNSLFTIEAHAHDGSAWSPVQANFSITANGAWTTGSHGTQFFWAGTPTASVAKANWMTLNQNALITQNGVAISSAAYVQAGTYYYFAAATNANPMFRRNGTSVEVVLGDQSAYTNLTAGSLQSQAGITAAGVIQTPGSIMITAAGGQFVSQGGGNIGGNSMATTGGNLGNMEIQSNGVGGTWIAYHRVGAFAAYMGLDTDNRFKIGGWSMGAAAYPIAMVNVANAGDFYMTGNVTAYYSDDRLKTRLGVIESALDKICSLDGFYYEANEVAQKLGYKPVREVGLSAQQVQLVFPEIVVEAPIDKQYLTIHYERLIPALVEAIKELKAEIDNLRFEILP